MSRKAERWFNTVSELTSCLVVKMGTTANQKKLFSNLRKAKSKIAALQEGDLRPDQVQIIAKRLVVTYKDD
jgi:RNA polymerase sigma-32 factor